MPTKDEIATENEALRAEVDDLKQRLEQLTNASAGVDAVRAENDTLKARVAKLEQALAELSPRDDAADEGPSELERGDDGLCIEHFPDGWDGVDEKHEGVGCEHGSFTRPERASKAGVDEYTEPQTEE